jgi:hypothetical protein
MKIINTMQVMLGLFFSVALISASSASTLAAQKASAGSSGAQVQEGTMGTSGTTGKSKGPSRSFGANRGKTVVQFSAQECTDVGGQVLNESNGVCNSGHFCKTTDQNDQDHFVCLSE